MLWTYCSFRCSLAPLGFWKGGWANLAKAGAGCLEATSIFNWNLRVLNKTQLEEEKRRQAGEILPPSLPPSSVPFFTSSLIRTKPSLISRRLLLAGFSDSSVRLLAWPRLGSLSGGIYIRPNHIKQRLGVFSARFRKKEECEEEGAFGAGFTIGIAVKWRERNEPLWRGLGGGCGKGRQILLEGRVMLPCGGFAKWLAAGPVLQERKWKLASLLVERVRCSETRNITTAWFSGRILHRKSKCYHR